MTVLLLAACVSVSHAADQPQWGQLHSRNMVSGETGLPTDFDPETGRNIKWSAPLGGKAYGTPIIAAGKVFVGANNNLPRDPRHKGDRGVLLCLNESDGSLCWQLVVPRIADDKYKDWPQIGMASPPTVEGDRIYTVTNRAEVVCLDIHGLKNGNDGPYKDEARHMAPLGEDPIDVTDLDADIIWIYDMVDGAGAYPHDSPHSAILIDGPLLYLNTCNGVDNTHAKIRRPNAPALIVLDKATGRLLAKDDEHIGPNIFHATWSSPAIGKVNDEKRIFFGGPDGVCYAFKPFDHTKTFESPQLLERVWRFDCDPTAPKENIGSYLRNREQSPSNILGLPVFYKNRIYVTVGGDIWWGKEKAWLECIDATKTGDITNSGRIWSYPLEKHACGTPSIVNDLLFTGDCAGNVHCIDAETGKQYWTHQFSRDIWGSTLAADGKVYVGSRSGEFAIFAAQKQKRIIAEIDFDGQIATTPTAANGTLYVATTKNLYAIKQQ
ncbi:MAG: PQQ-binding-like beta-propeller repeat protein [Planctomycetes bacterium]|nr:PQQ-binding-like beta-propeller repeat protein [Planctomycetota bacterium]